MNVDFPAAKAMPSDPSNYESKEPRAASSIMAVVFTAYESDFAETVKMGEQVGGWTGPHYLVDTTSGMVAQLVPELNVAYVTSVWALNQICIGIGLVGQNVGQVGWISDTAHAQLDALLTTICHRFNIPRDRSRIISQDEVPGSTMPPLGIDWVRLGVAPAPPIGGGEALYASPPLSSGSANSRTHSAYVATKSGASNGPTSINVGNIVSGDGVVAVGQNITQNISQTFIQVLGDVHIKLSGYHPVTLEHDIFDYDQPASEVITLLRRKGACAIVGFDGSGKSTLAAKCYYQLLRQNHNVMPQANGALADLPVYWVSAKMLLSDHSLIASVNQLVLNDTATTSFFLVLDDFDYLLDDMGNYKRDLVNSIQPLTSWLDQTPTTTSGIIVCTRVAPEGLTTYSMPGVDEADAIAWLTKLIGSPLEDPGWVRKAVREVHCYPGGLEALATARQQYGTLAEVFSLPMDEWRRAITHFYHLPEDVNTWFARFTPEPSEQVMLKYLSVQHDFASGSDISGALRVINRVGVRGPQALAAVVCKGLVEKRSNVMIDNDRGYFRIYDPLRNYIFDSMSEAERRSAYLVAATYYTAQVQRRPDPDRFRVDDLYGLESAIYYQTKAGNLKAAYALYNQYGDQLELFSQLLNINRDFQVLVLEELLKADRRTRA
jgi:N-acetylmuramoyl-L-alanine amidase